MTTKCRDSSLGSRRGLMVAALGTGRLQVSRLKCWNGNKGCPNCCR